MPTSSYNRLIGKLSNLMFLSIVFDYPDIWRHPSGFLIIGILPYQPVNFIIVY